MAITVISVNKKKSLKDSSAPAEIEKMKIASEIAMSAGTQNIITRDPVYHLKEDFKNSFDLLGQQNALKMAEKFVDTENGQNSAKFDSKTNLDETTRLSSINSFGEGYSGYEVTAAEREKGKFYQSFSEKAFKSGKLASAVMQNGGKTMFVSCIKRALGQKWPQDIRQEKLFSTVSTDLPLKNSLNRVVFNEYVGSAVGLVIDSVRNAREALKDFESIAVGKDAAVKKIHGETIKTMYPFLFSDSEKQRIVQYEDKLRELNIQELATKDNNQINDIKEQKAVIKAGIIKTRNLINSKRQMKESFLKKLEELMENSRKAEEIFSAPSTVTEIVDELVEYIQGEDDGDEGNNNPRKKKPRHRKPNNNAF